MNKIFYRNMVAANGWRWRIELFVAGTAVLGTEISPVAEEAIELPYNFINEEITWSSRFEKYPIGLSDTPTLKLSFNAAALSGNADLETLRARLFNPFMTYQVPNYTPPSYNVDKWEYDDGNDEWHWNTYPVPGVSQPPAIPYIELSNVISLKTDFGNTAIPGNLSEVGWWEHDPDFVFAGVQRISPPSEFDVEHQILSVEFVHLNRFCLEQINPSLIAQTIEMMPGNGEEKTQLLKDLGWRVNPGESGVICSTVPEYQHASTSNNIVLYPIETMLDAILEAFTYVRGKVIRRDNAYWDNFLLGYLHISRFYRTDMESGLRGSLLGFNELYFVGKVYDQNGKLTGGTLAQGSEFWGYKNMYDFLQDIYENAMYGHHQPQFISCAGIHQPSIYIYAPIPMLTADDIDSTKLTPQADTLTGVEVTVSGENYAYSTFGRGLADNRFGTKVYFHSSTLPFQLDNSNEDSGGNNPYIQYSYKIHEGKLYYKDGSEMKAVHPASGINLDVLLEDPFTPAQMFDFNIFFQGEQDITDTINDWGKGIRANYGLQLYVSRAIMRWYAREDQTKIECNVVARNFWEPMPRNIGGGYTLDAGIIPTYTQTPYNLRLSSAEMNILKAVVKAEFYAINSPVQKVIF